ncbi:hypothetical protein [Streptomyces tuirus]|uniref:hypothetical protein n=1 Tax=Streptomyces tuirus TaxID=68278 RepID=UPI003F4DE348
MTAPLLDGPGLITKDMPRPGAAVLDVGITTDQGLVGYIHPDAAERNANAV